MVKFKKRFMPVMAFALVVIMMISTSVPAFAAGTASVGSVAGDINGGTIVGQDVDQDKQTEYKNDIQVGDTAIQEECEVYATVPDSDIVVTVPKVQVLDGKSGASNSGVYTVEVKGDISATTVITVEPLDEMADRDGVNFEMSSAGKNNIPTDVEQTKTTFMYADGVRPNSGASTTGVITAYGMTAGKWNGSFEFNIGAGVEETKSATTNYTKEEVDNNERLIPIGKTDPYYVVAAFNDDYSEVTITKNGENSDGWMKDWSDTMDSPIAAHGNTLEVMNIEDGVKNIGGCIMTNLEPFMELLSFDLSRLPVEEAVKYNVRTVEETSGVDLGEWKLHTLNINGNTVTEIGMAAFACCNNLNNFKLNDEIKIIYDMAFLWAGCKNFPKMPAQLETINKAAFMFSGIEYVEFGNKISTLSGQAFEFCPYISNNVILPNSLTNIGDDALGYVFVGSNIDTFYGTAGSYAETWANENGYTFVAI